MKLDLQADRTHSFGPLTLIRTTGKLHGHSAVVWTVALLVGWRALFLGERHANRSLQIQYVCFVDPNARIVL